ncbi:hypothetical protein CRG93_17465 [Escherichia sp. E2593]|nr:hypothetical protein CRG93_17465 [Escherichia sp. E2593]
MTSVDVDILIAYSSKVAPDSLLFTADGRHIDSWGGIKKNLTTTVITILYSELMWSFTPFYNLLSTLTKVSSH